MRSGTGSRVDIRTYKPEVEGVLPGSRSQNEWLQANPGAWEAKKYAVELKSLLYMRHVIPKHFGLGDVILQIWMSAYLKSLDECFDFPYFVTQVYRRDAEKCYANNPHVRYEFVPINRLYEINGIPKAKRDDQSKELPMYGHIPTHFYGNIYERYFDHVKSCLGFDAVFDWSRVFGFLNFDWTEAYKVLMRFKNMIDEKTLIFNEPFASPDFKARYFPSQLYQNMISILRRELPGYRFVKVGTDDDTGMQIEYDFNICNKTNVVEYYHLMKICAVCSIVGSAVHFINGFKKSDALILFGGFEAVAWHYHFKMPFFQYSSETSCYCMLYLQNKVCPYFPGCIDGHYNEELMDNTAIWFATEVRLQERTRQLIIDDIIQNTCVFNGV